MTIISNFVAGVQTRASIDRLCSRHRDERLHERLSIHGRKPALRPIHNLRVPVS